ncbi:MAG TPA: FtsX-like permease family protein [Jiangellaceae bacterium]|nr:FtsX-like permease family protein [Jiangellaceae bacterium]
MMGLVLRALWWRRGASLAVLVAATLAVLAAAVAPLWARAAEESVVRARLSAEPVGATGYTTQRTAASALSAQPVPPVTAEQEVREEAAGLPAGIDGYFDDSRVMLATSEIIVARDELTARGRLVWRENQCDNLAIDGRCPRTRNEVVLTRRSAIALGAQVGDELRVPVFAAEPEEAGSGDPFPTLVTVAGVYRPPDAAESYWFDNDLFGFSPPAGGLRDPRPAHLDAVFVTQELLHALRAIPVEATAERALRVTDVRVDDLERIDAALDRHVRPNRNAEHVVRQETELPAVISDLADDRAFVRTAALLVGVQLLVLAWYALALVVTATSDARSGEVALARLRGLPIRTTVRHSLAEPLVLLALAVPIGGLLAYATVGRLAQRFLAPETPVRLDWPVWVGVALAVAGAVAAIVASSRRSLRRPVVDQLRRVVPTTRLGRVLTGEAIVLSAAAVAVYQLIQLGPEAAGSGLGLLAPGLVTLAVGIAAGRLVVLGARSWARRTRLRPRVPAFLASRQIARRHGLARTAVLVTVAVGISTFALQAWSIAGSYRQSQAAMEVGAATVVDVAATSPLGLSAATERADPGGRHAMAVAVFANPDVPPERRIVAVDSRRFPSLSAWHDEWADTPVATLADRLGPAGSPRLEVRGTRWRVEVETSLVSRTNPPLLLAQVRTADGQPATLPLGRLEHRGTEVASEHPDCATGCRVVGLTFARSPGDIGQVGATVVLRRLAVDGRVATGAFADAADWRPRLLGERREESAAITGAAGGGVEVSFLSGVTDTPAIIHSDVPAAVPAIITTATDPERLEQATALSSPVPGGEQITLTEVGRSEVLPVVGRHGIMLDLDLAGLFTGAEAIGFRYHVWLDADAPSSIVRDLEQQGLDVLRVRTIAEREADLGEQGPALALLLLLFGAGIAIATAATAAIASSFVEARRRAYELAALRTVGVRTTSLRRAAIIENAVLLSVGTVLGIAAGVGTAWLARATIPVGTDIASGPPVAATASWAVVAGVVAGAAVLLGIAGYLSARHVVAISSPALLREAQA